MLPLLLVVIYLSFISLGLPDSLLGSAWPVMYQELSVPLSYSGIVFMIIFIGTITSSLSSERVINKLGTGKTTFISVLMTALGMLGFSLSHNFILLCIIAIPYGLGAGSIDTALNNYVALHYESRHMSWLHCMWAVGASIGPYIMSSALKYSNSWNKGYRIVSFIQFGLSFILFLSLPLWNKNKNSKKEIEKDVKKEKEEIIKIDSVNSVKVEKDEKTGKEIDSIPNTDIGDINLSKTTDKLIIDDENSESKKESSSTSISIDVKDLEKSETEESTEILGLRRTVRLPKAIEAMIFFFCYCAIEQTIGLWASSFLVVERDIAEIRASRFASLYYIGITVGRAISGFITLRLNDNQMIYLGEGIILVGIILILLPFSYWFSLIGFILAGLGCAPIYPCMIHATPITFGKDKSQAVVGVQMASGSLGALLMPPLFGLISKWIGLQILPFYLGIILIVMILMHYKITKKII
ncbi:hypothetical protein PIROE2DRAFT_58502 [Piromyces sp. E2]|nr:hypothetical protein PIROE2DRAFT_58502 [Piromyces sp. E2]|eukprot:OUM67803.1 hypothetical protein PIROE2DRAFT_58502 [Piromyces sp. E2]